MSAHYTHADRDVNNLSENFTDGSERPESIIGSGVGHSKIPTFGEYLKSVMDELALSAHQIELKSAAEAERRGVNVRAYTITDTKVAEILSDVPRNHTMTKLCGLSWAIDRPLEEVVAHAFGFAQRLSEFHKSEEFRLWEVRQKLKGDDARYYAQRIGDLTQEIERKARSTKKRDR